MSLGYPIFGEIRSQETLQQTHLLHVCECGQVPMQVARSGCPLASDEKQESEYSACEDAEQQPSPVRLVWSVFVSSSKKSWAVFGPVTPVPLATKEKQSRP